MTPVRRGQWASRVSESERGEVEKNRVAFAEANASRFFERSRLHPLSNSWGCTGFDAVIDKSGLRVRELFSVTNEQIKRNDKSNVVYANFGRENRLAA